MPSTFLTLLIISNLISPGISPFCLTYLPLPESFSLGHRSLQSHPLLELSVAFSYHLMSSIHSQTSRKRRLCKWSLLLHFPLSPPPTTVWLLSPSLSHTTSSEANSAHVHSSIHFNPALHSVMLFTLEHIADFSG